MQLACDLPQVLARMIQIDDLNRARKMQVGKIPDPFGAVADDDFLFRATPAALLGLQVDSFAKLIGVLDGASVGGGIGIADGVALLVPRGLGIRTELTPGCGRGGSCPAGPQSLSLPLVFLSHPSDANRDVFHDDRQIQLHGR